jgi:hypothetical protein
MTTDTLLNIQREVAQARAEMLAGREIPPKEMRSIIDLMRAARGVAAVKSAERATKAKAKSGPVDTDALLGELDTFK